MNQLITQKQKVGFKHIIRHVNKKVVFSRVQKEIDTVNKQYMLTDDVRI